MIIGIYSPAPRCGKGTVASMLKELNPQFHIHAFAEPVKLGLVQILLNFGYPYVRVHEMLWGKDRDAYIPELEKTVRQLMDSYGNGMRQLIHYDMWRNMAYNRVKGLPFVIFEDLRYPNEWEICDMTIRVENDRIPPPPEGLKAEGLLEQKSPNWTLPNHGTIDQLKSVVKRMYDHEAELKPFPVS